MPNPDATLTRNGLWLHRDDRGIDQAVQAGMNRAQSGDWQSGLTADRVRALNGWLLEHAFVMSWFAGSVRKQEIETGQGPILFLDPTIQPTAAPERQRAAAVIYRTIHIVHEGMPAELVLRTQQTAVPDVGAWWAIGAVAVAVAVAQAVAIVYVVHNAAEVIDRLLQRKLEYQQLLQRDEQTMAVLRLHAEREKAAGKNLPLDEPSKRALDALLAQQNELIKRQPQPLSSPLPNWSNVSGNIGWGMLTFAAIAAGVWYLTD